MKTHRIIASVIAIFMASGPLTYADQKESHHSVGSHTGMSANSIIGKKVVNPQDEKLGSVQDLIIHPDTGRPSYAIIAVGASLNPNRSKVAVPFSALQCSPDEKEMVISATKEQLESAPKTATGDWAVVVGAPWTKNVDGYYGQPVVSHRRDYAELNDKMDRRVDQRVAGNREGNDSRTLVRETPPKGAELLSPPQDAVLSDKICEVLDVVSVRVQDGVAHIYGTVENEQVRKGIESKVLSIQGVNRVESHVKVKG